METDKGARFWDAINGDEDDPEVCDGHNIETALTDYADGDSDGLADGLYVSNDNRACPQPFTVVHPDGRREDWEVYGELQVVFHARRVKEADAPEDGT